MKETNHISPEIKYKRFAPILVVGSARSGTTLIGRILNRLPDVFAPGESHFFEDIWSRRHELGDLNNQLSSRKAIERMLTVYGRYNFHQTQEIIDVELDLTELTQQVQQLDNSYAALYYVFLTNLAQSQKKTRICDDTPKHLYYLNTVFDWYPKTKVIACVRDPRDFLCSYKNYWQRSEDSARIKALYHPITISLLWRSSYKLLTKFMERYNQDQLLVVRYEDLVNKSQDEVKRICDFLNVEYNDDLLLIDSQNSSFLSAVEQANGIFSTSVGRWRYDLKSHEIWWLQQLVGSTMHQYGYDDTPVKPSWFYVFGTLLNMPVRFAVALYSNKEKRGPILRYLLRRVQPFFYR
ncbi:MAG: sulfotransferase [Anaerolineales bacterium]|jgi:hypothetical protein